MLPQEVAEGAESKWLVVQTADQTISTGGNEGNGGRTAESEKPGNETAVAARTTGLFTSRFASWRLGARIAIDKLLDIVYNVNVPGFMPTIVQSCRLEKGAVALLSQQARRRHLDVSTLTSLYLREKTLEEEYPGVGFRNSVAGREAYVLGHRVAVWEVLDAYKATQTVAKTAGHFRWPTALVRCALAYAKAFPSEIEHQRQAEVSE